MEKIAIRPQGFIRVVLNYIFKLPEEKVSRELTSAIVLDSLFLTAGMILRHELPKGKGMDFLVKELVRNDVDIRPIGFDIMETALANVGSILIKENIIDRNVEVNRVTPDALFIECRRRSVDITAKPSLKQVDSQMKSDDLLIDNT